MKPPPPKRQLDSTVEISEVVDVPGAGASQPNVAFKTPFGKRLHWVRPNYAQPDCETIFTSGAQSTDQNGNEFDPQLLTALLGGHSAKQARRSISFVREDSGVRILASTRAQNMAIAFGKVRITPDELSTCLKVMDFAQPKLNPEDIELLLGKLPNSEEAEQLLRYTDRAHELRDIERRVLPLCIPQAERRMMIIHVAMTHYRQFSGLQARLKCMQRAARQIISSTKLRDLFRALLKSANYINHGCSDAAKTFSVKSLPAFSTFKIGSVTTLHYLCLKLCDEAFLRQLKLDLADVPAAARELTSAQQQEIQHFQRHAQQAKQHMGIGGGGSSGSSGSRAPGDDNGAGAAANADAALAEDGARTRVASLHATLLEEHAALVHSFDGARELVDEAQRFFEPKCVLLAAEDFFGYIAEFLRLLSATSAEIAQNPRRWQCFSSALGIGPGLDDQAAAAGKDDGARRPLRRRSSSSCLDNAVKKMEPAPFTELKPNGSE